MYKAELVNAMAEKAGMTKVQAKKALDAMMDTTVETLKKGEKVVLLGFGTFSVVERPARKGRNPRTGEVIKIKASKSVKFKAGAGMDM
ncbi:MAG: HU family DNA-binding protein, partial [Bacteroidales bacterium]|jgi:DNA-binding protein HU-beta|nr:HU family DNA-binding protein [Bacteroidales bacterium]MBQ5532637.1 HU family DNA-binding protein [Bacteroidales bacterium]MBQ6667958.1 HU family DNA-binding protein [Bacteroidales bacterium]MBR4339888.1 HU family DNA-binding protein [Bacteroidales bacterium]MBR4512026.1 HU family DNA-binding protein [Bacteroidales bacterium]